MTRVEMMLTFMRLGIVQFGHFTGSFGQKATPVQFNFTLLPSFPLLMSEVADIVASHIGKVSSDTRLLATDRTTAFGGVVAMKANVPLLFPMYHRQLTGHPTYSIEGTADVSNPIIMMTDVLDDGDAELHLHQQATRIGLPVQHIVALIDTGRPRTDSFTNQFNIAALYTLSEAIDWIEAEQWIPQSLANATRRWQKG